MDIYGAESHIGKLLQYVKDVAESRPYMYQKSKDRLRNIASTCDEVIRVISGILEEETLCFDSTEFDPDPDPDVVMLIQSMESQLNQLRSFAGLPVDTISADEDVPVDMSKVKISSKYRKHAIHRYYQVLKSLVDNVQDQPESVQRCSELVFRWFDIRFIRSKDSCPHFRYNIRRIPDWLEGIVICYGKHVVDDTVDDFVNTFNSWLSTLPDTPAGNKYAVPYEVYEIGKNTESDDLTLTAVVLWDMLLDAGLRELCNEDIYKLYPTEDCIYELCGSINPTQLDKYVDYSANPAILEYCKIQEVE